jgi:hypothetical protein
VLAYVFWHRPRDGVEPALYEARLRSFHAALETPSAAFRVRELPFAPGGGYEDWYLVEDWQALGTLNAAAIDERRRGPHDGVAELAAEGWGGVYAHLRGEAEPPAAARWLAKPAGLGYDEFLADLPGTSVWQRQLVLGPAPEFCVADGDPDGRVRVAG